MFKTNQPKETMTQTNETIKKYKIITMNFTEQFTYNYLLMARKNIDQAVGTDKNTQIKFNEKIPTIIIRDFNFIFSKHKI